MSQPHQTTNLREEEILRELRKAGGSCRVAFLADQLSVSNETIRRNIRTLEENSIVRKVHGGVHLVEDIAEDSFNSRISRHADEKARLAAAVATNISDGDSVFLDIGSTTAYVALELKQKRNLFVVTNSAFVANTLATRNGNRVFLAGGELRAHDGGSFGAEALDLVGRLTVQFAVFSASAVNADHGFMLQDLEEANLARVAAAKAQVRFVVADQEKFGKRAPVAFSNDTRFDAFYTDARPSGEIIKMLRQNDIELVVVE